MIHIKKADEPAEIFLHIKKKYSSYDEIDDGNEKTSMREQLIEEQGGLCAYCMNSIDLRRSSIEHYIPRNGINGNLSLSLDYRNMFAVCCGNTGNGKANTHCDKSKGDRLLNIDPRKEEDIEQIKYKIDGSIYSENPAFDKDLNETLNLNQINLKNNRKSALNAVLATTNKKSPGWNKENLQLLIEHYSKDYVPYVGIIRWFLNERQERIK